MSGTETSFFILLKKRKKKGILNEDELGPD
jgi:hypothetical protein